MKNQMLRSTMKLVAILFVLVVITLGVKAQTANSTSAELKKLDFLVGTWKGTGWILSREGKQTSQVTEIFQFKLGGMIAVVEGRGVTKDSSGVEKPVHQAFGVFTFDKPTGKIRFRYYKAETGEEGETLIEPVGKSITWGFDVAGGGPMVKFVQQIDDQGRWVETGDVSRDSGKTWTRFMETILEKVQ